MALSIMVYHLSDFTFTRSHVLDAGDPVGRLGIYGVSIFFVLSGLSMAIVYHNYFLKGGSSVNFYIRRIFRIWPLLWVACIFRVVLTEYLAGEAHYSFLTLFLNFTTIFGFVKPTAYIALGAWSIGNEMVYYALTPIVIMAYSKSLRWGNLLFLFTCLVGALFSVWLLNPDKNLGEQWATYVNPFNNFFLYVMGIAMYYNFSHVKFNQKLIAVVLIMSVFLFCFLPFNGDLISIVTGLGRTSFVIISGLTVLCFYKMEVRLNERIASFFEAFGAATYGVYLLHPIVYAYLVYFFGSLVTNNWMVFLVVVPLTFGLSWISYIFFESRMVSLGKKVTASRLFGVK